MQPAGHQQQHCQRDERPIVLVGKISEEEPSSRGAYADGRRRTLVANSDGLLAEDDQVRTRFIVQCVAVGDTGMQTGQEAPGRSIGFELFEVVGTVALDGLPVSVSEVSASAV